MNLKSIIGIKLLAILIICYGCNGSKKQFDIREFGAIADSTIINTVAIQNAINSCTKNGGGTVIIKDGVYVTGTILLKDNVILSISKNAKLIGSPNPLDYKSIDAFTDATGQLRGNCLIGAKNAHNIGISGHGTIDGNGISFLRENMLETMKTLQIPKNQIKKMSANRPFLLRFVKSSGIRLENIHLRQPAAWTCHFYQSYDIHVEHVKIYSHAHRNNDGIDLDSSHNAIIRNCDIDTGDDAICFKTTSSKPTHDITVTNCKLKSDWGAIKFGTESMGDFFNITVAHCEVYNTKGGGIKILSVDGANIHDIHINDITMTNVDMPIFIRLGERLRTYRAAEKQPVGSINTVSIKNVKATTRRIEDSRIASPSGILITGTSHHKIGSITLENIDIELPGGGTNNVDQVPELETNYPEFTHFKVLPAYGMYARHVENLNTKAIHFNLNAKDERPPYILEDVTNNNFDKQKTKSN